MKFVCEQCQSKYTIADEKVRGKVLKIRCVKCKNIIEVREAGVQPKSPAPAGAPRPRPPAPPPSPKPRTGLEDRFAASFKGAGGKPGGGPKAAGTPGLFQAVKKSAAKMDVDESALPIWFVAIDNTPVGPVSARAVHKHQKARKVNDDSLVWKEGMADWIRLRQCKDLIGLLARLDIEASLGGPAEAAAAEKPAPKLGLFADQGPAAKAPVESPLRGRSLGVPTDRAPEPEPERKASMPAPAPAPAPVGGGIAQLPAPPKPKENIEDDFFGGMESALSSIQSITPPRPTGGDRWVKVAAIGFFGVAVAVLVFIMFFSDGSAERQVVERVVERVVEVEKEKIVYRDRDNDPIALGSSDVEAGDGDKKGGKTAKSKGPDKTGAGETPEEKKRRLLEQLGMGGTGADPTLVGGGSSAGDTGSGGGKALSDKDFSSAVGKNKGSLQTCYEQSMKKGETPDDRDIKVLVKLTVGGSGMVKSAVVGGPGAAYPGLKSCIERSARKWIFPASSGESVAEFPFLFTAK
ncbi:MAG: zinc-ribbon domain-containing protein [Proteobacteria bacterium]|jgi:predicted Zn finger-like uncharacterized protein|nr:zinc-ribbon domain-containing protein [Pseudomonadota bacterium]